MGCSKNTVRRYLRGGGWVAYRRPERNSALRGLEPWLAERLQRHHGNADVVRQDVEREHGIAVSLRTVERAVAPFRRELRAAEVATIRFETAPGEQLQIDFGETGVAIAGERVRVHLFVATLGFRADRTSRCSATSGSRHGGKVSRAPFTTSAVARVSC
jgi:transposase